MKPQTKRLYRQLLVAALMMGGAFNMTAPVLAAGTYAGTGIVNRATATYEDPNDPLNQDADPNNNATINATSNTVTIRVAEVAGITVISKAVTDTSPTTPIGTNDIVNFDFEVTNTGNDTTQFYIPDAANISVSGGIIDTASGAKIEYSTDAGANWIERPTNGLISPIAPNASILVRVPVKVTANAMSANVVVTLGNTGTYDANNVGTNTQDQPDNADTAKGVDEVRTEDIGTETAPNDGAPVNGEREASARGTIQLGAVKEAFALVTTTRTGYTQGNPNDLNDDTLTYSLGLEVKGVSPDPQLSAGNLVGSPINLDGSTQSKILVSDAIPANTVLSAVTTTLPANWKIVYSLDDPAVTNKPANDPSVAWLAYNPASPPTLSTVKRIGFIHDGPINAGQSVTSLSFTVTTTGLTENTKIANIAQVFGYTEGSTTLIYDESGDSNPNNYEGSSRPATNNPTNGVANPAGHGEDTGNNNTATNSPGGEDNVFTLSAVGILRNGPFGQPEASNNNINDDFTNKTSAIATNITPGTSSNPATLNPDIVSFQNTIKNTGSSTINNLLLVPTPPTTLGDLQPNTQVKLTYGSQTATYTYTGTVFNYTPGAGV